MNCNQVDIFFDREKRCDDLPRGIAQHLGECRRCEAVYSLLNIGRLELSQPPSPVRERIVRELISNLHPVSPLPDHRRLAMLVLGTASAIVLLPTAMMGARALPLMTIWQIACLTGAMAASAAIVAVSLACQNIPGSRHYIAPRPVIAGSLLLMFVITSLVLPWRHQEPFIATGLRCSLIGMMIAIPAVALLWFVLRRGVVFSPEMAGASLGLMGGIAALAVLQLNCRIIEAGHVAAWHLGVALLMTLIGFSLGAAAGVSRMTATVHLRRNRSHSPDVSI